MALRLDLTGIRFGRLTAIKIDKKRKTKSGGTFWICRCDCGNIKSIYTGHLRNGKTSSCRCLNADRLKECNTTHGLRHSSEYNTWSSMKARCYNPNNPQYKDWGGRGIKVCDRWLIKGSGFENFLEDMGRKPSLKHSLDRIDNDNAYYKENCRWAIKKIQANNTRTNIYFTYNGNTKTFSEWVAEFKVNYSSAYEYLGKYGFEKTHIHYISTLHTR